MLKPTDVSRIAARRDKVKLSGGSAKGIFSGRGMGGLNSRNPL